MRSCFHVEIETPKKVLLNGLWFGPKKPKRVIVWMHGLGSSAFSKTFLYDALVDKTTAVLAFNNRGHDKVASSSHGRGKRDRGGAAHEVFTECVDDIQGAINFGKKAGVRDIYLAGHSTGCQKSAYWGALKGSGVKGIMLLAPMSDYASEKAAQGTRALKRAESVAREYIQRGKKHQLLPENVWSWSWMADAQRFMSLYTGNSAEEIFTYWDPKRNPKTLRSVKKPLLVLLAEHDEYADRPAKEIATWFKIHLKSKDEISIVPDVGHSFRGGEKAVAKAVHAFMKE